MSGEEQIQSLLEGLCIGLGRCDNFGRGSFDSCIVFRSGRARSNLGGSFLHQSILKSLLGIGDGLGVILSDDGKYVWVPFEKVDKNNVSKYQ